MRALILSDIHGEDTGFRWLLESVWKRTGPIDAYLFLGDGLITFQRAENFIRTRDEHAALYSVTGNNDFALDGTPPRIIVPFGGLKLLMVHGHRHRVKLTDSVYQEATREAGCDIGLFGHTHIATVEPGKPMLVNPGAVCDDRCALLTVEDGRPRVQLLNFGFN